jgi:class 3 adenylate cyclase
MTAQSESSEALNSDVNLVDPVVKTGSVDEQRSRARLKIFSKFLSDTLLRDLVAGRTILKHQESNYSAAVLFADVSGFTNLTEKLMGQYGREQAIGAEHLTFMLSDYFDHLIDVVLEHNGDVIKFAGDAMLIMFPCTDVRLGLQRATSCGVEMQRVAKQVSARILQQHKVVLSLKVAVSSGDIVGLVLGGVLGRWEYAVISDAIADVGRLGDAALPHDVLISAENLALIEAKVGGKVGGEVEVKTLETEVRGTGICNVISTPDWSLAIEPQTIELAATLEPIVRCFVPAAVASRIAAGQSDTALLGELRRISVLFINLPQFTTDISIDQAQKIVTTIQQACYGQRGSLDKISCDDKGVSVIAGFGVPPMSAEDDPIRAVKAAMNIHRVLNSMGLSVSIGVASGPVYCGTLGDKYRCEYTLMGDGVNTAARLMSIANDGVLCDSITVEASRSEVEFDQGVLTNLKGKDEAVETFRPLNLKVSEIKSSISIIGREQELEVLVQAIGYFNTLEYARAVVIEGEAGMGKSVLLDAFNQSLSTEHSNAFYRASASTVQISFYGVWRELLYQALGFSGLSSNSDKEAYLFDLAENIGRVRVEMLPLLNDVLGLDLQETDYTRGMRSEIRAENIRFLIGQMLQQEANTKLLIMVIDDAQWMDSASWSLLESLIRDLINTLFIVLTQPFVGENPASLNKIVDLSGTRKIVLSAMAKADIAVLVCQQLKVDVLPDSILDLILERAEGHPLYSEVLANDLAERSILIIEDGVCALAAGITNAQDIELPSSMESAIVSRLERLSLGQQLALKTASVIGRQFSMQELHYLYPVENDRESLNLELDALCVMGMTQPQVRHVEYFFKHLATQRIAYDLMLYSQRKKMHRQAAQWIELNSNNVANKYPDLALHWRRAEEPAKAITYLALAAEQAHELFANRETLDYLDQIEELLADKQIAIAHIKLARWKGMSGAARLALGRLQESDQDFRAALALLGIDLPNSKAGFLLRSVVQIMIQVRHRYLPLFDKPVAEKDIAETHLAARIMERHFLVFYFLQNIEGLLFASFAATNLAEATADDTETLSRSYTNLGSALGGIPLLRLSNSYLQRAKKVATVIDEPGTWAWYYLAGGMAQAAIGDWFGHDKAILKSQEMAMAQGDRRRWEESAAVYCIGGLTHGNFISTTEPSHIYQQIYASGFSRGVYQSQSWGYCMWAMSSIMQGHYGIAKKVAVKLEKLYLEHPQGFDPVNVLEASTSFALLAIRDQDRYRVIQYLELGASVLEKWRRPTTWRSIPCCYAQAEAALRFWYQEKELYGANCDPRFEAWVKLSLKNLRAHAAIYDIAVSRYELLNGWYQLMSGRAKKAARHWRKGLKFAANFNMRFDLLALNLAATNLDQKLRKNLTLMSSSQLVELAEELNVTDPNWFRDWRLNTENG